MSAIYEPKIGDVVSCEDSSGRRQQFKIRTITQEVLVGEYGVGLTGGYVRGKGGHILEVWRLNEKGKPFKVYSW